MKKMIGIYSLVVLSLSNGAYATEVSCQVSSLVGIGCYSGATQSMAVLSKNSDGSDPASLLTFDYVMTEDSNIVFGKFFVKTMKTLGEATGSIEKFSFKLEGNKSHSDLLMIPNPDTNETGMSSYSLSGEHDLTVCGYTGKSTNALPMTITIRCKLK